MKNKAILTYYGDPAAILKSRKLAKKLIAKCKQYTADNPQKTWDDYSALLESDQSEGFNKSLYDKWVAPRIEFNHNHPLVVVAKWKLVGAYDVGQTLIKIDKLSICEIPEIKPHKKNALTIEYLTTSRLLASLSCKCDLITGAAEQGIPLLFAP